MLLLLLQMTDYLFFVYTLLLFVRIISSWLPEIAGSRWMLFVAFCTDPYLNLFRHLLPPLGMFDLSPMLAFFALQICQYSVKFLIALLFR